MKTHTLLFILLLVVYTINAQNNKINNYPNVCDTIAPYYISVFGIIDSINKTDIKYYRYRDSTLVQGAYALFEEKSKTKYYQHTFGTYPIYTEGIKYLNMNTDEVATRIHACFNKGEPCNRFTYSTFWEKPSSAYVVGGPYGTGLFKGSSYKFEDYKRVYKRENYKDGLLHGKYKVEGMRVRYETTFNEGTGYYKDYYPPTKNKRPFIRMEGALVDGLKDGTWLYYIVSDDNKDKQPELKEIYIENFRKGKVIDHTILTPNDQVEILIQKAIEWERLPKKQRKGRENPYLKLNK